MIRRCVLCLFPVCLMLAGCAKMNNLLQPSRPDVAAPAAGAVGGELGLGASAGPAGGMAGGLIIETLKKNLPAPQSPQQSQARPLR
jgi:hypothetical protein